jgi:hypothetical protein
MNQYRTRRFDEIETTGVGSVNTNSSKPWRRSVSTSNSNHYGEERFARSTNVQNASVPIAENSFLSEESIQDKVQRFGHGFPERIGPAGQLLRPPEVEFGRIFEIWLQFTISVP